MRKVLDATCGSRMIWFNKNNEFAIFCDKRELEEEKIWTYGNGLGERTVSIHPDIIADFTDLPFEDETFYHVVFDPPHMINLGENSWMYKKYGKLERNTWKSVLRDGFNECMRVLKPYGTLIFKWNECQIPVKEVIKAIGHEPLYGNRSGKQQKTHWMAFVKGGGINMKIKVTEIEATAEELRQSTSLSEGLTRILRGAFNNVAPPYYYSNDEPEEDESEE